MAPAVSAAVDVNVLIYASRRAAPEHEQAQALLRHLLEGPELLYLFWPVLIGFLRLATNPAIVSAPGSPEVVKRNIDRMLTHPHVRTPGEAGGFWNIYRQTAGDHTRGGNMTDAHIAALMRQHGVRVIYTRDRDFRRFDGIDQIDPFA